MAFINLLKNGYRGKLGETVGQKWKNELTLRTYQGTNNSKSEAQLQQRAIYKAGISTASIVYNNLHNITPIKVKGMNYFNHVTSNWLKSGQDIAEFSKISEWYVKPNMVAEPLALYVEQGVITSFYSCTPRLTSTVFPNSKLQGVLLFENNNTKQLESAIPYLGEIGYGSIEGVPGIAGNRVGIYIKFLPPPGNVFKLSFQLTFENKDKKYSVFFSHDLLNIAEIQSQDVELYDWWLFERFNNF